MKGQTGNLPHEEQQGPCKLLEQCIQNLYHLPMGCSGRIPKERQGSTQNDSSQEAGPITNITKKQK